MTEHRSEWINFEEEEKKSQERIKASLDIKVNGGPMSRLESISNNFSKSQFNDGFGLLSDDVEWMIERLERYEKALKGVVEQANSNNCNWCGDTVKVIAEEALNE